MPTPLLPAALLVTLAATAAPLEATQAVAAADVPAAEGAGGQAFVTLTAAQGTVYVGEPIELTLRFGLDAGFLEHQAVPLFRRPLDVPVQLAVPALQALSGTRPLPPLDDLDRVAKGAGVPAEEAPDAAPYLSFALNDDVVTAPAATETRDGHAYTVLTITRRLVAGSPGELVVPAPTLRYAFATDFREDFVNERVPVDRREARVSGEALTIDVLPLPEEGRPFDFGGAVGSFTLSASASPLQLQVGQTLELVLVIEGSGNLPWFTPPQLDELDAFDGFHLIDAIQSVAGSRRTIGYELMPHRVVTAIPAVPFSFFEPGPEPGYRTITTEPIPLAVRPADAPR